MNCSCGHPWEDHAARGSGECVVPGCGCPRFTQKDAALEGFAREETGCLPVWSAAPRTATPEAPDGITTLGDARAYVDGRLDAGVVCPCCYRHVQRYRTAMNRRHGRILAHLFSAGTWVHVDEMPHRDVAFLRHWGLVQEQPKEEGSKKKTSGVWKLTAEGEDFVALRIRVPSHAVTLRGELLYLDGTPITHTDVLPRDFDYRALMAERPAPYPPGDS